MILHGDLFDVLPTLDASSIDACVTDPPYGIGFMGKEWDTFTPGAAEKRIVPNRAVDSQNPNLKGRARGPASSPSSVEYDRTLHGQRQFQEWTERWSREVYRVLKPGAYIVVCGAPRSHHRMMSGLEDAGFMVRDCLAWLFGQGFPKSLNLGSGRGTALKPAHEPIALAWKPVIGTIAANVDEWGTGSLNIDACRIEYQSDADFAGAHGGDTAGSNNDRVYAGGWASRPQSAKISRHGRWPANVLLDEDSAEFLDEMTGELTSGANPTSRRSDKFREVYSHFAGQEECEPARGADIGGASRFYYVAKPSREERDYGCDGLKKRTGGECTDREEGTAGLNNPRAGAGRNGGGRNFHPTVKPVELMRWLVRLVTPPNGTVLDPFLGSGTTGMACRYEHREFIGIEKEAEYVEIATRRIAAVAPLFSEIGQL